jgi:hypothetical protein
MIFHYSQYPYVHSVELKGRTHRTYHLLPYQFTVAVLEEEYDRLSVSFNKNLQFPMEQEIVGQSFKRVDHLHQKVVRLTVYENGRITRIEQEPDENGRFRYILHYSGGRPGRGHRDLDGDGRYEIQEDFVNGRLKEMVWDQNGDGNPEYAQSFEEPSAKYWDYNGDGIYDSREYVDERGRIVREFSSTLNGSFDLKAVIGAERSYED